MKGCMYSAQGDLVCNKSSGGPSAAKPWVERYEEPEMKMNEGYYEEPEEKMHEGYYEEPEEKMHEGYYEHQQLPETEQFYNGFAPSFANMGNGVAHAVANMGNTVSSYGQHMFGMNHGPAARR